MYNNPFINNYNHQANIDKINNQIAELEKLKQQMTQPPVQQPTNLTQNFQIAPTNHSSIKYANSIQEVQKDIVIGEAPYFSNDMSVVWIKDTKGNIKTYELKEIIPKDEKDMQIEYLQAQIEELKKGMIKNEQSYSNDDEEQITTDTSANDRTTGTATKKSKSSSIQKISRSKEE